MPSRLTHARFSGLRNVVTSVFATLVLILHPSMARAQTQFPLTIPPGSMTVNSTFIAVGGTNNADRFAQCLLDALAQGLSASLALAACQHLVDAPALPESSLTPKPFFEQQAATINPQTIEIMCNAGNPKQSKDGKRVPLDSLSTDQLQNMFGALKMLQESAPLGSKLAEEINKAARTVFEEIDRREEAGKGNVPKIRPLSSRASACDALNHTVRETLAECQRVNWKSSGCQTLLSRMKGCADPRYAYLDPNVGPTCAVAINPDDVAMAFKLKCQQVAKPGPGGQDPCDIRKPPAPGGAFTGGHGGGMCSDPVALIDPNSDACVIPLSVGGPRGFHEKTVTEVIVWIFDKYGGPIIVLPSVGPGIFPLREPKPPRPPRG